MTAVTNGELTYGLPALPALALWTLGEGVLHLNHGSFGGVPRVVQERQNRLRAEMDAAPVKWFAGLPTRVRKTRHQVADVFGVARNQLAFVNNASAGATAVFHSQPHRHGCDVVVTDHGYGAVTMGAARLARRWGGQLKVARVPLSATAEEAARIVVDQFTDRSGFVVVDHITSATARALPAAEIAVEARKRGIPILVDGAHVPGHYNNWVSDGPWDYWVGNLHKFFCSPRGAAILIANAHAPFEPRPLIDSWGATLDFPESFDSQGTLDLTAYLASLDSWELLDSLWGWPRIWLHMEQMADYGERIIAQAFADITGEQHLVSVGQPVRAMRLVRLPHGLIHDHDSADAVRNRFVAETGSEAAFTEFAGEGFLRISTHAYTTRAQLEQFAERFVPLLCRWAAGDIH